MTLNEAINYVLYGYERLATKARGPLWYRKIKERLTGMAAKIIIRQKGKQGFEATGIEEIPRTASATMAAESTLKSWKRPGGIMASQKFFPPGTSAMRR